LYKKSFILSVIIHVIILAVISWFSYSEVHKIEPIAFNITEPESPPEPPPAEESPQPEVKEKPVKPAKMPDKIIIPPEDKETIVAADEKSILEVPKDSAAIWTEYINDYFRSLSPVASEGDASIVMDFNATEVLESTKDSSEKMLEIMEKNLEKMVHDPEELKEVAPPRSDVGLDYIRDRYSTPVAPVGSLIGLGAQLASKLLGKLFGGGDEEEAAQIFDLTFDEITIMKIIWNRGRATTLEVYERLPRGTHLRMTTLQMMLEQLTKKGMLNSKEREYENIYFPKVSRQRVIDYYMVYLSELNKKTEAETGGYNIEEYKDIIRQKIRMVSID